LTATARLALVTASVAVLVAGAAGAPRALRHWDLFAVQRVELVGARHLTPQAALRASGINAGSNVFDDPARWLESLQRHPLVAHAAITRRLPDTIVIGVVESVPVAFARTPELRPVDEHGRVLPADPSSDDMDLPVLAFETRVSAAGHAADSATLRVVRLLAAIARHEPELVGWISEADVHGDAVRLVLRAPTEVDVLLPAQPAAARLRELHLTLATLSAPRHAADAVVAAVDADAGTGAGAQRAVRTAPALELSQVRRIDARFHEQIVGTLNGRKS
jgi:hypothetical protein